MTWWDFLSDFVLIVRDVLNLPVFSVSSNDGVLMNVTVGGLLSSVLIVSVILFYFVPRR